MHKEVKTISITDQLTTVLLQKCQNKVLTSLKITVIKYLGPVSTMINKSDVVMNIMIICFQKGVTAFALSKDNYSVRILQEVLIRHLTFSSAAASCPPEVLSHRLT